MIDWKKYPRAERVRVSYFDGEGVRIFSEWFSQAKANASIVDAAEWNKKEFGSYQWQFATHDYITYLDGKFSYSSIKDLIGSGQLVCTRNEFELYVEKLLSGIPTQKTVADAVAALSKEELTGKWEQIRYAPKQDYFFPDMNRDKWFDSVHVCTRAEFEAYVKEQEGEKWTHVYGPELKCRILAVDDEHAWILTESGSKFTEYTSSLKPIKPTISEADAVALAKFSKKSGNHVVVNAVADYLEDHDII